MIYDNASSTRDPLKQDLALDFCRKKNKGIIILIETNINHDQIHHQIHIRNNWLSSIFFCPGDSHKKGSLVLLLEVDTNLKGELVLLKLTPLHLMPEFCVYALSGYSTREKLARRRFFEGLQN